MYSVSHGSVGAATLLELIDCRNGQFCLDDLWDFSLGWLMVKFSVLGVLNGLISAVLAIGLLPYLSLPLVSHHRSAYWSFRINHPLLRKLLMEAPGVTIIA